MWVFEPEFQNVLAQGKREGNTLSSALRDVWDGGDIKPATKSNRIWATRPHIGLHGCITPGELLQGLEANEITNGFANRFLMVWAERTCLVPVPPETPQETVAALADRVAMVIRWATGHYPSPSAMYSRPMRLSPAAESAWTEAYFHLKKRDQSSERITALLERRAPITRRLAALFAATDQQTLVEIHHLEAALAWADYHRASVEWIFGGDAKERQQSAETAARREKIRDFLKDRDWVLRSEITARCFSGRIAAKELDMALQGLLADRELEQRTEERGGSARNTKRFYRRWAQ